MYSFFLGLKGRHLSHEMILAVSIEERWLNLQANSVTA